MIEYVQGAIAGSLVLGLVAIGVVEAVQGKPFSEPLTLSGLALAAVSYYFGQAGKTANRVAAAQGAANAIAGVTAAAVVGTTTNGGTTPAAVAASSVTDAELEAELARRRAEVGQPSKAQPA